MTVRLSAEFVRLVLHYQPEVGLFFWKRRPDRDRRWNNRFPGTVAGTHKSSSPYVMIQIKFTDGKIRRYHAHRLAWVWMTGNWPTLEMDHVNGKPTDNRWTNLRLATKSQNQANRAKTESNRSGFKGVCWHKASQKWVAQITKDRKVIYLGGFNTREEAHAAYTAAASVHHGEFARAA